MASVTNFIRNTPLASLRDYFTAAGIEFPTPVNWDAPEPEVVRPLLQAVDQMDDEARGRVINDGERVGAMADVAGQTALYSVVDDREVLDELENGHARAMWLFINDLTRDLAEADLSRHQFIALGDLETGGAALVIEPTYLTAQLKAGAATHAGDPVRHAAGFRHFWVGEREFKFGGDKRRQIVEYLFNAWDGGEESVSTEVMFADLEFDVSSRMRDIFKGHPDWRDLIETTGGSCRLRIRELLEAESPNAG